VSAPAHRRKQVDVGDVLLGVVLGIRHASVLQQKERQAVRNDAELCQASAAGQGSSLHND